MAAVRLRLALDQNFPKPLLASVQDWLPEDLEIVHLDSLDRRLGAVSDRELFIALKQLGLDGLITNNYRMLNIASEVAAIVATKAVVVAVQGMGDDPIRAAGALLLELPGLRGRVVPKVSNVFLLNYAHRRPEDAWNYLKRIAERDGVPPDTLWQSVKLSQTELNAAVLN